jgi:hypothetical protein
MTTLIRGMKALGDCIYQRPYVRRLREQDEIYLETPWPQLYTDLNIHCLHSQSKLRRSSLNAKKYFNWADPPKDVTHGFRVHVNSRGTALMVI